MCVDKLAAFAVAVVVAVLCTSPVGTVWSVSCNPLPFSVRLPCPFACTLVVAQVTYANEPGIDMGGLYREALSM